MSVSVNEYKKSQKKLAEVFRPNFPNDKTKYSNVMPVNGAMKRYTNANCGANITPNCIAATYAGRTCKKGNCNQTGQQACNLCQQNCWAEITWPQKTLFGEVIQSKGSCPCVGPQINFKSNNGDLTFKACVTRFGGINNLPGVNGCEFSGYYPVTAHARLVTQSGNQNTVPLSTIVQSTIPGYCGSVPINSFKGVVQQTQYNVFDQHITFTAVCH